MDKTKMIEQLNAILRHEWTGVAQYAQAGFVVTGLWREVYLKMFSDSATESFGHARKIGEKISALGGVPTIERNEVRQSDGLEEMLQHAYEFESKAVALYTEALALSDQGDRALTVMLEDILVEEQEGVDHLELVLRQQQSQAVAGGSATRAG